MFKYFSVNLLLIGLCGASILKVPSNDIDIVSFDNFSVKSGLWSKWEHHVMDFVGLIDMEKVMTVFMRYLNDPEVMNFVAFLLSTQFEDIIKDFKSIPEFEEAIAFLASMGYDINHGTESFKSGRDLLPYGETNLLLGNVRGLSGFIDDIIAALPMEDMKNLFETKLANNPEVAELFATINSDEFIDILRRLSKNPKFIEIKVIFESYGFDFKYLCRLKRFLAIIIRAYSVPEIQH